MILLLSLNTTKTKFLVFEERMECNIRVNGKILEQFNEVVYLGTMFSRDGRYEMDAERRIVAGNRVNGALPALMRHNAVLVPTLLYGSKTWV